MTMLERVEELYAVEGVSCICVVGGCGAYFKVNQPPSYPPHKYIPLMKYMNPYSYPTPHSFLI